jgi:Trk-type K+ transport system membrane component
VAHGLRVLVRHLRRRATAFPSSRERRGQKLGVVAALFTATSATCVTGLSVIDIGSQLTLFGQLVVLALIQLGGLGITTFRHVPARAGRRRLSVQSEFVVMSSYAWTRPAACGRCCAG